MSNIMRLATGLIILFTVSVVHAATITYTYDSLNRLTNVNYGNGATITYTYDKAGNRLTLVSTPPDLTPPSTPRSAYRLCYYQRRGHLDKYSISIPYPQL